MLKTGRKVQKGFWSEPAGGKAKKPRLADKLVVKKREERLLKEVKKKGAWKGSSAPKRLPPRVAVEGDDLTMKGLQVSDMKSNLWDETPESDRGDMEVDIDEDDDAARKIEVSSMQKWKWLQEADTPRKVELKGKWKQRLELRNLFAKKGEDQYCCLLERCRGEETCWNERQLFLHCYREHRFWNNVEF